MTRIRALVLDFDGLILDTESSCFAAWQALFTAHGHAYDLADFQHIVGTHDSPHDPRRLLEARCGHALDWAALEGQLSQHERRLNEQLEPLPGIVNLLDHARDLGLQCGVASSSRHRWVDGHLQRLGLCDRFHAVVCRDDGLRAKPEPDLFREAVRRLGVAPAEALAIEDSHNGSLAAKRAGLWCLVVPNAVTRSQDFRHADASVPTLAGCDLTTLLRRFETSAG